MTSDTIKRIRKKILDRTIYDTKKYIAWRNRVFKRDKFQCKKCLSKGGHVNAHHIKTKYSHPHLIYKVSNGVTLCKQCHDEVYQREKEFEKLFIKLIKQKTVRKI